MSLAHRIRSDAADLARKRSLAKLDAELNRAEVALLDARGRCDYRPELPPYIRDKFALRVIPGLGRIVDRALEFLGLERRRTDLSLLEGQIRLLGVCRQLRADLELQCQRQEERIDELTAVVERLSRS